MQPKSSSLHRIAHRLFSELDRSISAREKWVAYLATLGFTAVPLVITMAIIGLGTTEANGVMSDLIHSVGFPPIAVISVGAVVAAFAVFGFAERAGYPWAGRAGMWSLASVSFANTVNDILILTKVGLPETWTIYRYKWTIYSILISITFAIILFSSKKPKIKYTYISYFHVNKRKLAIQFSALLMTFILVISGIPLGFVGLDGPIGTAKADEFTSSTKIEDISLSHHVTDIHKKDGYVYILSSKSGVSTTTVYKYNSGDFSSPVDSYNIDSEVSNGVGFTYANSEWLVADYSSNTIVHFSDGFSSSSGTTDKGWNLLRGVKSKDGYIYTIDNGDKDIEQYVAGDFTLEERYTGMDSDDYWVGLEIGNDGNFYGFDNTGRNIVKWKTEGTTLNNVYETSIPDGADANMDIYQSPDGTWYIPINDGSGNKLRTYSGTAVFDPKISGRVVSQSGSGVSNVTVVGYVSNKGTVQSAQSSLDELSNPFPAEFIDQRDSTFHLMGESGAFDSENTKYAGIYSLDDINDKPWEDSADLQDPFLYQVPTNRQVGIVAGDSSNQGGLLSQTEEFNRQIPGTVIGGTVVIEKLSPSGEVVNRDTIETKERSSSSFFDPSRLKYAKYQFTPGIYRITVKGSEFSYLVQAGQPSAIMDQHLENVNGGLTEYSEDLQNALSDETVSRITTTTGTNGSYTLDPSKSAKIVHVQAYKSGDLIQSGTDPKNVTTESIRDFYDTSQEIPNGSIYFPTRVKRVSVPSDDVELTMVEFTMPSFGNLSRLQDKQEQLRNLLENGSFADLGGFERLEELNRDELENVYGELNDLRERNDRLDERYQELLEDGELEELDPENADTEELKERIRTLQQSIDSLRSTIDQEGPPTSEVGSDTASAAFEFDEALDPEDVSVIARYSDGTQEVVSDEYLTIDSTPGSSVGIGSTSVEINEFPLGDDKPAAVSFAVRVANEEGIGKAEETVKNPTFQGALPKLDSVTLSTLKPGPDDSVEVTVNPEDGTPFDSVTSATVWRGTTKVAEVDAANITDDSFTFSTDGSGTYFVEATVEDTRGNSYKLPFRVQAGNSDIARQPGLRVKEGPLGAYTIAGDGFTGADAEIQTTGGLVVTGVVAQNADIPPRVHVYMSSLSTTSDSETTIRLTRGEQRSSINKNVEVLIHGQTVSDDALIYRNGDEPISREGTTYGQLKETDNGSTILTYTDAQGEATVSVNNSPSNVERLQHWFRTTVAGVDIPVVGVATPAGGVRPTHQGASA